MEQQDLVSGIRRKLEKLIDLHQSEKQRANQLESEVQKLSAELGAAKAEGEQLREELKIAKISRTLSESELKTTDAKLRINELIKEVDRCIALMNE